MRAALAALAARYAAVPKAPLPHADVGDWCARAAVACLLLHCRTAGLLACRGGGHVCLATAAFQLASWLALASPAPRTPGGRWALYDYGPEAVAAWPAGFRPDYPGAPLRMCCGVM